MEIEIEIGLGMAVWYRDRDRDEDSDRELRPFSRCFDLLYSQGHGTFLLVQLFFLVQGLGFRV